MKIELRNTPLSKDPLLSKNAIRRGEHTYAYYVDGERVRGRSRFDIGRYLDRSKYNGDGSRK